MPKKRPYGQFCPIATALDRVGDRWTLLIVRELFIGPMRYSELLRALDPISTDVLANRLRELETLDIITNDDTGYTLSDQGRELAPVLQALGRWGAGHLGPPTDPDQLTASRVIQMLAVSGASSDSETEPHVIELRADDATWTISSGAGGINVSRDPTDAPDATVSTTGEALWALRLGETDWSTALSSGAIDIDGNVAIARRLLAGLTPAPAA